MTAAAVPANDPRPASVPAPALLPVRRARAGVSRGRAIGIAVFIAFHVVLALAMRNLHAVATVHGIATATVGVLYAATTTKIRRVSWVVAYIAGCEVLWRMNGAGVFYEFGKYAVIAVLLVALARLHVRRNRALALLYVGLLLPSMALTFAALDLDIARQQVAFNMSGPMAIAISTLFFSNIKLTPEQLRLTFVAYIGPVIGLSAVLVGSTVSASQLDFGNGSNFVTSGGFGPNQVSAVLGFGVLMLLLVAIDPRTVTRLRVVAMLIAMVLATQSILTFARGGILLALAGISGAVFVLMRNNRRARITVAVVVLFAIVLGRFVIQPRLETFTNGKLSERYLNASSSGRDLYIASELDLFREHPAFGVGPGMGYTIREQQRDVHAGASHTEYTRMIAEHGVLGLIALGCLLALVVRAVRQHTEVTERATAIAMAIWFTLFLAIYGVRIVAPAIALGLAFVRQANTEPIRRDGAALGTLAT
jgi:O-antigen ligase